jgi:transcription initiation factor TFIIF subunit alpha
MLTNLPLAPLPENFPTINEIRAAIPPDGLTVSQISQVFGSRIGGRTKEFSALMREAGDYQKGVRRVMPRK